MTSMAGPLQMHRVLPERRGLTVVPPAALAVGPGSSGVSRFRAGKERLGVAAGADVPRYQDHLPMTPGRW